MRRLGRVLAIILLLALSWLGWSGYEIWSFGALDSAKRSDCVIVLGAAADGANPSPVFEERIRHAIHLYQRGFAAKIVFTGGYGNGMAYAESDVAARYAVRVGVPPQDILTETRSRTTQQNLAEAKTLMNSAGLRSAVIVSDPLHLRRAALMAADLEISAVTSPTPSSRYRTVGTKLPFLLREIYFRHHYRVTGD